MTDMTIEAWEYHCRMLGDIANKSGAAMLLFYNADPEAARSRSCVALAGGGDRVLAMIAALIDTIAKDRDVPPSLICDIISTAVEEKEKRLRHEREDTDE